MATHKLSGNQVVLGGATILSAPTIYASAYGLTTSSTGGFKIYGDPKVAKTSTNTTQGAINLGGLSLTVKKIHLSAGWINAGGTSLRDTNWDAPANSIIDDVWIHTITAATSATNTINVGIAATANGLLNAVQPVATWTPTAASYGGKLNSGTSTFIRTSYHANASTNKSVTVSRSATTFSATWVGDLYIRYMLPSS